MTPDRSDRMMDLEIHLAHVQRLYEQLDEVVTEQTMKIDRMQRKITELQGLFKELKERQTSPAEPGDEKPPHY